MIFPSDSVVNMGISGDTIDSFASRAEQIISTNAEAVFVNFGINDSAGSRNTPLRVTNIYQAAVSKLSTHMTVVVQSILPTRFAERNKFSQQVNEAMQRFCTDGPCEYLDISKSFVDADGLLMESLTTDGIHLSGLGYLQWARELKSTGHFR